jgi:hypothetical protein
MVRWRICIDVEKHEKLFVPKFDGFYKHVDRQKALAIKPTVTKG